MRPFIQLLRAAVLLIIGLFVLSTLLTHFQPRYIDPEGNHRADVNSDRSSQKAASESADPRSSNGLSNNDGHIEQANERLHEMYNSTAFKISSYISPDHLIQHFTLERSSPPIIQSPSQSVLFLTITKDENSWGRNPTESPRTIYSFLDFITNTTLTGPAVSIGLLTASQSEFEFYKRILTPTDDLSAGYYDYPFQRITLVLHTAATRNTLSPETDPAKSDRKDRHAIAQHERRAILAKLRNYLQSVSLHHETHILWLDSDVYKFSSVSMVETMMKMTTTTETHEVGILTSRCRMGEPEKAAAWLHEHPDFELPPPAEGGAPEPEERGREGGNYEVMAWGLRAQGQYDLNAWKGRRTGPNNVQQEKLWSDIASWEPHPYPDGQTAMLDRVVDSLEAGPEDVVRLDSVGGTILMIRADLIRMGLNFAAGYYVGMTFEHGEGYDGIETEGLCLLSRSFSRDGQSMCYSMGNPWSVWHTIF